MGRGLAERASAVDVREEPLRGARKNVQRAGLAARVTTLQANGILPLEGRDVDAIVMAGLSGRSIERCCAEAERVLSSVAQLVLQPNQNVETLRAWAYHAGWHLRAELLVEDHGRSFVTCAFVPGSGPDPAYAVPGWSEEALFRVGPRLLTGGGALAKAFYEAQRARLTAFASAAEPRVQEELAEWQAAALWAGR